MRNNLNRQFEIPYNFDKNLIDILYKLKLDNQIYCIYIPPFQDDYVATRRSSDKNNILLSLSRKEYEEHILYINKYFPNKLQLLLQRTDGKLLTPIQLKYYINLGFKKFCIGNVDQGILIKNIDNNLECIGSITMHITKEKIFKNFNLYKNTISYFVLDFSYCKDIDKIKELPSLFSYVLMVNSFCNIYCNGDQHWWANENTNFYCPGIFPNTNFNNSCLIRPIDLTLFDQYIKIFKLQGREFDTTQIIQDLILYNIDYTFYPNISPDISLYQKGK